MTRRTPTGVWLVMLCLATPTRAAFFVHDWFARHKRKAIKMTGKASRATFNIAELQGNAALLSDKDLLQRERRDAILDLDDDAFEIELQKYIKKGGENGRFYFQLTSEGMRLVVDRHSKREEPIRDAWRPDDISEADQYPEPLKTVVAFRLLCVQYVAVVGISMDSLKDHWKRSKLYDLFSPMADDVAAAMVATNEDPKGLYRSLAFCNETDQMRFVDAWRGEILPALKVVEIKLKNQLGNANATNGNEHTEADSVPAVGTGGTKSPDADKLASLAPCERKAYLLHTYAETKNERRLTDREAWEYLNEHGVGDDGDELKQHELPLVGTYADYMNRARRKLGEKKYTPRGGRANGSRSVQKPPEI